MKNLATPLPEPLIDVQVMSYYFLRPTQLVRNKTRKKGMEQLVSISLSLGCGASIIKLSSPKFLMTMFYYSQLSNKSTGTMEKKPTKISCGTHFFLRYYWKEFMIFTCGTFISAVL